MQLTTIKKKVTSLLVAGVAVVTVLALSGTAQAIGEGQIAGGDIYKLKNVTKNSAFADTAFADKCETVQYKVRLHNPGPGIVNNVHVKATLPSTAATTHVSTVTITGQNAQPATVSDTATLKVSTSQKVEYISGSTQLLDTHSNVLTGLPDGITAGGSGVSIGNVGVSLNEIKFVQFKAKLDCPQQPPCVDNPQTPGDECNPCKDNPQTPHNECKPTDTPPATPPAPTTPTALPETGPAGVAAIVTAVTGMSSAAYYWVVRRRSEV